jgi:thiamine pyrophosphate-dependent acetolactate synthase large subunit-like protein/nitrite reductase/ring-hydroxylating ferredoxin subunit
MTLTPDAPTTLAWHRVADAADLPEGRVVAAQAGHRALALTRLDGEVHALDGRCPHQGGPLGEGTIEGCMLRCPWHGYDFDARTGASAFGDGVACHPAEVRDDGGVWVGVPAEHEHPRTASDVLAETLVAYGVTEVFGMVGHSNLGTADALRRREEAGDLRFTGIRHEGAAAFAASAYGKLTGRPAACLTIAGPGATNLLTGLWDARLDGAPVIALTGQVDSKVRGLGAFQDVDLAAAFGGVAAWTATLQATSSPAEIAAQAVRHAVLERGVSHLVLPDEVQAAPSAEPAGVPATRIAGRPAPPPADALHAALELLAGARRPVIVAGHGARAGRAEVLALAEALGAPVITTFKAKGLLPDTHPLAGGVLGRSGTPVASWLMNEADALLVLGASFSNHTGIYPGHPTVQVDDDARRLGERHPTAAPVLADVGLACRALRTGLDPAAAREDQRADVAARWALWRAEKASRAADDHGRGLASAAVMAALSDAVPDDAVICVDVGNHAYSFGRYFESGPAQDVLMSGYLGSIGFALPAALGAAAATRGSRRRIVAVCGDGGFGQYAMELTTAVRHRLPITVVLLDNGQLGKISKEQRAAEWDVWQTTLHNPDFAAFARLCGAHGAGVGTRDELPGALAAGLQAEGPALVCVRADPDLL